MKEKISRNKISRHYKSFFELDNMALAENDNLMIDWGESLINELVNQEVEKRIAERMPSEEEIEKHFTTPHYHYEKGHYYKVRKDRIFGANWLRSRLAKTEGGGE
jgi:regulator of sirC expression with transglutaminase-like and TPR domain